MTGHHNLSDQMVAELAAGAASAVTVLPATGEQRAAARVGHWLDKDAFGARSDHEDFMTDCQALVGYHAEVVGRTVSVLAVLDAEQLFAGDDDETDRMVGRAVERFERTLREKIEEHRS